MRPSVLRPVLLASHDASSRILTLTLNRPEARNALNRELIRTLTTTLELVAAEPPGRTRAVVIAAAGAAFCSGHDLRELATLERAEAARVFSDCSHLMSTIRAAPAPVIAAVHGAAHAAGCQLAATCDVAVSHHAASFATPGTRIGLFCHTPGVALARAIGSRAALPLLLSGRPVDAPTALRLGLVHEVFVFFAHPPISPICRTPLFPISHLLFCFDSLEGASTSEVCAGFAFVPTSNGGADALLSAARDGTLGFSSLADAEAPFSRVSPCVVAWGGSQPDGEV